MLGSVKYCPKISELLKMDGNRMNENLSLALRLAELGWKVFPCSADKKPLTAHGYKDATTDLTIIKSWKWPLIGIYCEGSRFFAVDVDRKNGIDGLATWAAMIAGETVDYGPTQQTPSGGLHYLFKLPAGLKVPNNAGKLGPGLDLRSTGYICTGTGYKWLPDHGPETPLTDAPSFLIEAIRRMAEKPALNPAKKIPTITEETNPGEYWLNHYLLEARPGNRNNTGWALACQLRDSGILEIEAHQIMIEYAARVPGTDYTEDEAIMSMRSAYNGTPREPATLPGMKRISEPYTASVDPAEPEESPFDNSFENVVEVPEINPRYKIRDATFFLEERPPIEYLIDNLITVGSVNLWVGKFGSKKTWSALSAAVCVAAGKTWLGMKVKQGTVLIIDEESGEDRLSRRINLALRGELVQNEKIPIKSVSLAQFNLLKTPDDIRELTSLILSVDAALVIVDALSDIMAGGDENSVRDTQPVCMALRRIADFTKTAVILIHHVIKTVIIAVRQPFPEQLIRCF